MNSRLIPFYLIDESSNLNREASVSSEKNPYQVCSRSDNSTLKAHLIKPKMSYVAVRQFTHNGILKYY